MLSMIANMAKPLYSPRPYHNFGHARMVYQRCMFLLHRCYTWGVPVNEEVLTWAAWYHDADFASPFRQYGLHSAEELSAYRAAEAMRRVGSKDNLVAAVHHAICATNPGVIPISTEAMILRSADLSTLASNYSYYLEYYSKVKEEFAASADPLVFFTGNLTAIAPYLWPILRLTPECWNSYGASDWHLRVLTNITRNYVEICYRKGFEPRVVLDLGCGRNPIFLHRKQPYELVVGIDPDDDNRRRATLLSTARAKLEKRMPEVIIPGQSHAVPLPDASCLEIVMANLACRHPEAVEPKELLRLLSREGQVRIIESYQAPDESVASGLDLHMRPLRRICTAEPPGEAFVAIYAPES